VLPESGTATRRVIPCLHAEGSCLGYPLKREARPVCVRMKVGSMFTRGSVNFVIQVYCGSACLAMIDDIDQPRTVNRMLGEQPSVGPIPGDQFVPWLTIAGIVLGIQVFFSLHWLHAGLLLVWGISTWWLLTGKKAWRFLSRFHRRPRWIRGFRYYQSPFTEDINMTKKQFSQKIEKELQRMSRKK